MLGQEHPDTLLSANNLAGLFQDQGRLAEAEPLFKRALEARERVLGKEHPETLLGVNNLAALFQAQGRLAEAEPLYKRALEARERVLGPGASRYADKHKQSRRTLLGPGPLWPRPSRSISAHWWR